MVLYFKIIYPEIIPKGQIITQPQLIALELSRKVIIFISYYFKSIIKIMIIITMFIIRLMMILIEIKLFLIIQGIG